MAEDIPMAVRCAIVEFLKAVSDKKCARFVIKGNMVDGNVSIEIHQFGYSEEKEDLYTIDCYKKVE